ncbi:MAG: LytR family transcriptional regulator, partial [Austwickia sp.]|nr:LytR family transcriptional regulator [Austwickia sp.]
MDRRKFGGTLLTVFVCSILGAAAYLWVRGPQLGALTLAVDSDRLLRITVAAVVAALVWVISIIWTAVATWPRPAGFFAHSGATVIVMALCAALVAPAALGVRDVVAHRGLLD